MVLIFKKRDGFGIIEVLSIMVIIAVLFCIVALKYKDSTKSAKDLAIIQDIQSIQKVLDISQVEEGRMLINEIVELANEYVINENGEQIFTEGIVLYKIDPSIMGTYIKNLNRPLEQYYSDINGMVYYKYIPPNTVNKE